MLGTVPVRTRRRSSPCVSRRLRPPATGPAGQSGAACTNGAQLQNAVNSRLLASPTAATVGVRRVPTITWLEKPGPTERCTKGHRQRNLEYLMPGIDSHKGQHTGRRPGTHRHLPPVEISTCEAHRLANQTETLPGAAPSPAKNLGVESEAS